MHTSHRPAAVSAFVLFLTASLFAAAPARAEPVFGHDFRLNNVVSAGPDSIRLTRSDVRGYRASAFLTTPIALGDEDSFEARFGFRIDGGTGGADGLAFVLQNDRRGTGFVGLEGGNLGFFGVAAADRRPLPFGPAWAVFFDTFRNGDYGDLDSNHIATVDNTSYQNRVASPAPWDLNDGRTYHVWVDYTTAAALVDVFLSDTAAKPTTPLLTDRIDLGDWLGGTAWMGFTAATGGLTNDHYITGFDLDLDPRRSVPEPGALALAGLGLGLLGLLRARRGRPGAGTIGVARGRGRVSGALIRNTLAGAVTPATAPGSLRRGAAARIRPTMAFGEASA